MSETIRLLKIALRRRLIAGVIANLLIALVGWALVIVGLWLPGYIVWAYVMVNFPLYTWTTIRHNLKLRRSPYIFLSDLELLCNQEKK